MVSLKTRLRTRKGGFLLARKVQFNSPHKAGCREYDSMLVKNKYRKNIMMPLVESITLSGGTNAKREEERGCKPLMSPTTSNYIYDEKRGYVSKRVDE